MKKREAELRSLFTKELKQQLPQFIVLLHYSNAAPDRSITGNGITSFYEFKHGTPDFKSPDDQEIMCSRIAAQGYCRYVIWQDRDNTKRTLIVTPAEVKNRKGWTLIPEASCIGFDMEWLVCYIRGIHGLH